ncbi:SH3 domain-containing protein [Sphingomonas soli]|uniref:SH3 domain-containing protein n=1 Tax=Sphingomonas soli TaxID=266127 RepID=UPI001FE08C35|nr:SH3 domain-containing protein [Sphingomonas soli]
MAREIASTVGLRAKPDADSEILTELSAGEAFEVLELSGLNAWGVAPRVGLVGYIAASALAAPAK